MSEERDRCVVCCAKIEELRINGQVVKLVCPTCGIQYGMLPGITPEMARARRNAHEAHKRSRK